MEKDDGGPAFPAEGGCDSGLHPNPGMSLRDWFAGQALASMGTWTPGQHPQDVQVKAAWAYDMADAMLLARTQSKDKE